jgi:hypothetical protein
MADSAGWISAQTFVQSLSSMAALYFSIQADSVVIAHLSPHDDVMCTECNWILPNREHAVSDKPSAKVKEAFEQHKCAEFPREAWLGIGRQSVRKS